MDYHDHRTHSDPHRWIVFVLVSMIYFLSLFNRVSTSVIALDLMAAFHTDATTLGVMSSMYFWFYAVEQPFVGYLTDRLGPRLVVSIWALMAAAGCILFGLAPTMGWAMGGRALIGLGAGGIYVPAMKAFAQWFRKQEFATMNGFLMAWGNLGGIVATTPLVWMVGLWGWRGSFIVIGGVSLILAAAVLIFMKEFRASESPGREAVSGRPSTMAILASLRFWFPVVLFLGVFGSYVTLQGLWATPFLVSIFHMGLVEASGINMLIPLGFIIGAPLSGWLLDRFVRDKITVIICLLAVETGCWLGITAGREMLEREGMAALLCIMGMATGGLASAIWSWVRDATPTSVMGFTTGLINPSTFVGVAVLQVITGAIMDYIGRVGGVYPPIAYRNAFLVCLIITAVCLMFSALLHRRLVNSKGRS